MTYYHINKSTLSIIKGPLATGSTYIKKLTSCGNPELLDLSLYDLVPCVKESLGLNQRYSSVPIITTTAVTFTAEDIPQEDIDASLAEQLALNIERMDIACRNWLDKHAHWSAGPMIYDKAKANKPKAQAIKNWTEYVWQEYYTRKSALLTGTPWDESFLDFTSIICPYTIYEAMTEV